MRIKSINILTSNRRTIIKCTFIIICFITYGCTEKKTVKENVINIEMPHKLVDKYFITNTNIIKLQTNDSTLLGFLMDVKISSDTIYVLDQFIKRIYLFDMNGKNIGKIDNLGKGPNEYLRIQDFDVFKNEIYLLTDNKIIIFNKKNLQAKREVKLDNMYPYSLMVGKKNITLSTNNFPSGYILNYLSKENLRITSYLQSEIKSENNKMGLPFAGFMFHSIPNKNKSIFHFTFSDYIYTVSDSGFECTYLINLRDYSIPKNKLTQSPQLIKDYIDHEPHMRIYNAFQFDNTLAIYLNSSIENNVGGKAFLIRTPNNTSAYNTIIEKNLGINLRIIGTAPTGFVGFAPFEELNRRKEELHNKQLGGDELSPQEQKFISEFNENSNPYLVIFNFID
jgi:hypothetical protein